MSYFYASPETGLWNILFPGDDRKVVAVVGAGGKTSTVKTLAAELSAIGRKVVVTTTTKMHPPENRRMLCETTDAARTLLQTESPVWAGLYYNEYKIEGIPDSLPALAAMSDHVLIEADGAKKLPLKMIDRTHEPVIPPETDAVIAVAGMDGIGKPLAETVHRPEIACSALGLPPAHIIAPKDVAALLQVCYAPKHVILNKADTPALAALAEETASYLPGARCIIASLRKWGHSETRSGVKPPIDC